MKLTKKFSSLLFATLTAMTTILPVQATEVSPTSESVESVLNVSVVGSGSVEVIASSDTYDVDASNPLEISLPENMAITLNANTDGEIADVTKNGETLSVFKAGKSAMSFNYITTRESVDFVITFDKKQQEESKLNTSVESENEAAKDEDVGQKESKSKNSIEGLSQEIINDGITLDFTDDSLPTDEELAIIKDYRNGVTEKYKKLRKEKAEETGLIKYADDDYFMNDKFYEKYGSNMLLHDGAIILDRKNVKGYKAAEMDLTVADNQVEVPSVKKSRSASARIASSLSVTEMGYHRLYNGVGYIDNGIWRLSNGALAFCAQGMMASPHVGDGGATFTVNNNPSVVKALYYGYGGPGDCLTGRYGTSGAIVITDDILSKKKTQWSVHFWKSG